MLGKEESHKSLIYRTLSKAPQDGLELAKKIQDINSFGNMASFYTTELGNKAMA